MGNAGAHGFMELLYAYTSNVNGNGSAMAGFNGNTTFFNLTMTVGMIVGRYLPIALVLALAGRLVQQQPMPVTVGTLRTHGATFVVLATGGAVILALLNFLPALSLATLADALSRWMIATMTRGQLRIYLGPAPGVGKTYKMLEEAHRRADRGTDVVLGYVEPHGRARTAALLAGLEQVPRRKVFHKGGEFADMDVDAILARAPEVAVVDELAHTNAPGSRNTKRWQDVNELLDAGITVLSTVNIQHLESLGDVITRITGVVQRETVPDAVVRAAEQVELVDMTPEALRRRMAHGNVYPPDRLDAALANYFRTGNLTALRELALLWLADQVDDQLDRYRAEHDITNTWEARERIVVALTGGSEGDTILRRAARIAERTTGAELVAVHVVRSDGLINAGPDHLARQRALVEGLGGTYHQVVGNDIPAAVLAFARGVNATQLVLGASRRGPIAARLWAGVGATISAQSGQIDVHLVHHEEIGRARRPRSGTTVLSRRRRLTGFVVGALGLPLLIAVLVPWRAELSLSTAIVLVLGTVVAVALIGGVYPAVAAAVIGFVLLDFFFTPPIHSLAIADGENLLALAVFVVVALAVSTVVEIAARRTADAARASAESDTLSTVAGSVLRGDSALPALLVRLRETFGMNTVTLLERRADAGPDLDAYRDPDHWRIVATTGEQPCRGAVRRRRGGGRRRGPDAGTARASPARRRAADRRRVRGPGRGGASSAATGRAGRRRRAAGRGRPDAHRAALGGQPRSADAAGRRDGRGRQPARYRRGILRE